MKPSCRALIGILFAASWICTAQDGKPPVRVAVVGLSHDHAYGFFSLLRGRSDVEVAGVVETNRTLIATYTQRYHLSTNLFFSSLDELFARQKVQAVAAFTSTFEHRAVVESCAPEHVDVMVEKPLAVNREHARAIEAAARRGGIQVFVNYETTWYAANHAAYEMVHDRNEIGEIRKIVVHDGHRGPKEIGCSEHFLAWLTDPVLNGGGALNDFGCYGANLATWLMDGQRPLSVMAVTQRIKPDVYPRVEDEATIVVTYPSAQAVFQASWNWAIDRKDMEIYGHTGQVLVPRSNLLRALLAEETDGLPPGSALTSYPTSFLPPPLSRTHSKQRGAVFSVLEARMKANDASRSVDERESDRGRACPAHPRLDGGLRPWGVVVGRVGWGG